MPRSMSTTRLAVLVSLALAGTSLAADPQMKGTRKDAAPKLNLDLPDFGALPTGTKLESSKPKSERLETRKSTLDEGYSVVRVVNGKAFLRGPEGAKSTAPFTQVTLTGNTTEKFSTVVRVKSPARRSARIEVLVLDFRGDTVMEASGELVFRGGDETEWTVDWEPTGVRGPGEFQVLVRVGGNPLGTFPVKFAEAPAR